MAAALITPTTLFLSLFSSNFFMQQNIIAIRHVTSSLHHINLIVLFSSPSPTILLFLINNLRERERKKNEIFNFLLFLLHSSFAAFFGISGISYTYKHKINACGVIAL
jgi:hypothetical protein